MRLDKTQIQKTDKLYVVTRKDLFPGAQIAQAIHAITEFGFEHPDVYSNWHSASNYICVLSAKNENELLSLIDRLIKKGIKFSIFREPDLDNEITAIAIEPAIESKKICSSYSLALKEHSFGCR